MISSDDSGFSKTISGASYAVAVATTAPSGSQWQSLLNAGIMEELCRCARVGPGAAMVPNTVPGPSQGKLVRNAIPRCDSSIHKSGSHHRLF